MTRPSGQGMTSSNAQALLDFWLHDVGERGWFRADDAVDAALRARFGALLDAALTRGERFEAWAKTPRDALARLILLDQLPRNLFRDDARAFALDPAACAAAEDALARGHDAATPGREKMFFYMPFMHAETLAAQDRSVALFEAAGAAFADNLKHAVAHRAVIARFGRFPHRNAVLGRESTSEEATFLAEGGYAPGAKKR